MMKILLQILITLVAVSMSAQNYWEPINFPDTLFSKAINAEKEGILFVASGSPNEFHGLFRSYDEGITWELLQVHPPPVPSIFIYDIRYNADGILFLGANGTIYRSLDDGDHFDEVYNGGNNFLKINFSPSNEIYAVGWQYIVRSQDNGDTWETLFTGDGNQCFTDLDFGLNGEIFAVGGVYEAPPGSAFYRSVDDGKTWEVHDISEYPLYTVRVNADGVIILGGYQGIYTSVDNGLSWNIIADIQPDVMESDDQENLFAGRNNWDNGCWFSEDWGETWISLVDSILNPWVNQISISPDNYVYVQCQYSTIYGHQLFKSIDPIVGVTNHHIFNNIQLFPNPATNKISVVNKSSSQIKQYSLYNLHGQKVLCGRLADDIIDVSGLTPGLYIIEFALEKNYVRRKVLIK
jgi:photosystem II stability/assembly factor-like uncharacterized protein